MDLMIGRVRFGRQLRRLRLDGGWTVRALARPGMSPGHLAHLENGTRNPTEATVRYLAGRLGVTMEELLMETAPSLLHAFGVVATSGYLPVRDRIAYLRSALDADTDAEGALRGQALWLLTDLLVESDEHEADDIAAAALRELEGLADRLGEVELSVRSRARLAGLLRAKADPVSMAEARRLAAAALEIAGRFPVPPVVEAEVLMAVLSTGAESDPMSVGAVHLARLEELAEQLPPQLCAQALWTVAMVHMFQGSNTAAVQVLEQALASLHSRDNLPLWVRLRLAAGRLHLGLEPADTNVVQAFLDEAAPAVTLLEDPKRMAELRQLQASRAVRDGDLETARVLVADLGEDAGLLEPRDLARLREEVLAAL
ncbi:helix-turn-helix domain-containing protein [Kitasatospora sp. NPDC001261]|uniref:helix-turn-helix domain-containing protein n=1 Tax=Kitasatospora sp. NPDC001261 TaxID=3364012 RepID=UPI0036A8E7CE